MKNRLYDANLYRFGAPQPSYWEATAGERIVDAPILETDETCDVAIIGGGYTGLSAALHLARDYSVDVRLLEAGHIGWGASGRNGGFCSMGGTGVHRHELVKMVGMQQAADFYRAQLDAIGLVRKLGVEEAINFQAQGEAELEVAHTAAAFERLQSDYQLITREFGVDAELLSAGDFRERYYDSAEQFGALVQRPTFGLHPLKFCRGLAAAAVRRGAHLHQHSEATAWEKLDDGRHRIATSGGSLTASRVVFACNGFMPELLHPEFAARTLPVISAIIVTRPLTDAELAAHAWTTDDPAINSRRILNYFRLLPDNRILFGGRGHGSGHAAGEAETYVRLEQVFKTVWPNWSAVDIDYRWHGLICVTGSYRPSVGRLDDDPSVYFGYGYHGNGVNSAPWSGAKLAEWLGTGSEPPLPEIIRGLGRKLPLAAFRLQYLKLGIAVSAWLDRRA